MPWSWVTCKVVANFDSTPLYHQLGLHFSWYTCFYLWILHLFYFKINFITNQTHGWINDWNIWDIHSLCHFWITLIITQHQPAVPVTSHTWSRKIMNTMSSINLSGILIITLHPQQELIIFPCFFFQAFNQLFNCERRTFLLSKKKKKIVKGFLEADMRLIDKFIDICLQNLQVASLF